MGTPADDRLDRLVAFIVEIDRLKGVLRQTMVTGSERHENDAEHSWHLALTAVLLAEYACDEVDLLRVVKMVLVHDLVEIDAGDTFVYDTKAREDQQERERAAAERIFGILPADLERDLWSLWEEFEARETPEARYAAALDRFQPILLNYHTQGAAWQRHGIRVDQVIERNAHMEAGAPALWAYVRRLIEDAVEKGYLAPERDDSAEGRE
ncbi:MAG: HD domain-containing protein [Candidatus Latescibacteria bacterium]|nr:HD domain-containing protein [Candidatus Latescibacterota bacterium]